MLMVRRILFSSLITIFVAIPVIAVGQAQVESSYQVPLTEYGHPDLQGLWTDQTRTPLQRPVALGMKRTYTPEEAAELEQAALIGATAAQQPLDPNRPAPAVGGTITQVADVNFARFITRYIPVKGEYLTSLIVEPEDGRLPFKDNPPLDIFTKRTNAGFEQFDGPEIRPANERCLGNPGQLPLIDPLSIDGPWRNMQIVQNEDYVLIFGEYHVVARIVRLNKQHHEPSFPKFYGDSVGQWEGNTLVVHTKSFKPDQSTSRIPSSRALEIVEQYTRVSESEIFFEYQITDPEIYTQTITAQMTLVSMPVNERLYESACHEGNYSLSGILAGARRQEADARLSQ
jgi:hypothetical protein